MSDDFFNEEAALAELLAADVLFCSEIDTQEGPTISILLNCNDTFFWAAADAECVTLHDLPNLHNSWKENPKWGAIKWASKKRNMRPIKPLVAIMKKDGVWDNTMENLPQREN